MSLVIQFQFLTSKFSLNSLVKVLLLNWVWLFATPWTVAWQGWDFQQEYWSLLPFLTPRDLPDPRIEPISPASSALAGGFFTTVSPGKPLISQQLFVNWMKSELIWRGQLCLPFLYTKNFMKQTEPDWAQSPKAIKSNFCSNNVLIFQVLQVKV